MSATAQEIWQRCTAHIRREIPAQTFDTWFKPIVAVGMEGPKLILQLPSPYFWEILEKQFVHIIGKALVAEIGPEADLEYQVIVDKGNEFNKPLEMHVASSSAEAAPVRPPAPRPVDGGAVVADEWANSLHPHYNFSNYVEGECNRLARAAGMNIAEKPLGNAFNPLIIYGGVGFGKTHLVHAIGNKVKELYPDKVVIYVSSERFISEFIEAVVRTNQGNKFMQQYMKADVLIIDDIQFLSKKEGTQNILFNIFNHLHTNRKQIIFTSDCPPNELEGMHERMLTRFKMGLVADLNQPDFETRIAIIQKKIQQDGIDMPFDVIEYLAKRVSSNVRELEGVLISLIAQGSINNENYNLALARQIVEKIVSNAGSELNMDTIQTMVSSYFGVTVEELKAQTRKQNIAKARQVAMYIAKEVTDYSLASIGAYFGGRDHTTVLHAVRTVGKLMAEDDRVKSAVTQLQQQLKAYAK